MTLILALVLLVVVFMCVATWADFKQFNKGLK